MRPEAPRSIACAPDHLPTYYEHDRNHPSLLAACPTLAVLYLTLRYRQRRRVITLRESIAR